MAHWLLACKEVNGKIFVSRLPQSTGTPPIPGVPSPWFYVGPGSRPCVQHYSGDQFILVFDYLSHMAARVLDISVWPPNQVDPITTNPISIGAGSPPQGPDDSVLLRLSSTTGAGISSAYLPPPQISVSPIFKNLNQYSVVITTANGWASNVPGTNYFRVYRQPLLGGNFVMVQDWVAAPLGYVDTNNGSLQFKYTATLGNDFDPDHPNDPTKHRESSFGNIVAKNSATDQLDYVLTPTDPVNFSNNIQQSTAYAYFGSRQQYLVEAVFDDVSFKITAQDASQSLVNSDSRKDFVVFSLSATNYTPPSDVMNFSSNAKQGQATLNVSARLDQ